MGTVRRIGQQAKESRSAERGLMAAGWISKRREARVGAKAGRG